MVTIQRELDEAVDQVAAALGEYEAANPGSECLVYRYNPASIRVRIVDSAFHGRSKGERHDYAWDFLQRLPEDVLSQISILLCLEPGESSFLDSEFHAPVRSYA
jgi:stress-induced morphogen